MSFQAKLTLIVITAVIIPLISILLVTHLLSGQAEKIAFMEAEKLADTDLGHILENVFALADANKQSIKQQRKQQPEITCGPLPTVFILKSTIFITLLRRRRHSADSPDPALGENRQNRLCFWHEQPGRTDHTPEERRQKPGRRRHTLMK